MNLFNYRSAIRRKISGGGIFILLMLATGQVLAQSKAVSGTVKSQQGEPLTGVTILIEGTTQGTSTDAQGAFTLQAKPDDMLAVSYLGYKSQRVKVGTRTKLEVVLTEDQNLMDEVVVVGYGTQRRRNIVGAVENISGEVLENRPNAYLLRSIQGQIPGVNITMADGKPSRSASINIRANTQSIGAGGSALCLIDGVEGDLTAMNPEDVESISVLKDASSTAVYGARGAFGVVLVTTKSARKDKISVDYSGSVSIISETVRPKYETDSQTWYDNYMTAYVGYSHHLPTGINNFFPWTQSWEDEYKKRMNDPDRSYLEWELDASGKYQYYGRNTDWYDLFYKKSTTAHQHNIRISGGGKTSSFIASARYYEQDGIYRVGDEKFRQRPEDLDRWYVRNDKGEMVPFSAFCSTEWKFGSSLLERFNGLGAVNIQGAPAAGFTTGQAMLAMEEIAKALPYGFGIAWNGISFQEQQAGSQTGALYTLSILIVFLCLAALYESWSIPIAVILVVPLGVIGALGMTGAFGMNNDVYFQVGLLTTIGLVSKNAILIVEFAKELHEKGESIVHAAAHAVRMRIRPIMMTSLAFGLGVLPLAKATGAGSGAQNAIGIGVLGGMLTGTFLCIFFVPLFYVLIVKLFGDKIKKKKPQEALQENK